MRLPRGIKVGRLGISACGVGCSSIDLSALLFRAANRGGLGVCLIVLCGVFAFDRFMWGVCGIDWVVKGVRRSDDSFCGMGVFDFGLQHEIRCI